MPFKAHQLFAKINPNRNLKARLGLATVGAALLLSSLLSLIAGHISRNRISNSRGEFLASLAFQMADKLDRGLFERYRDIQILASLDAIRQPDISIDSKRALIEKLQTTYSDYAWIGLTDAEGNVLASTGRLLEGKNAAKRPWFQQAHQTPFAGDVHEALLLAQLLQNETEEPLRFVDLAAPVTDENGVFQGVLGAHLSWTWTREVKKSLLDPLELHSQVEISILSAEGRVLLGPNSLQGEVLTLKSVKAGQSGRVSYLLETWPDDTQYLTGFAPSQGYRNYPGLGWTILIRQPAQLAFAPARSLQMQVFAWGAFLGSLCAIGSWSNARRIVSPLLKLTTAANQIQQGDTSVTIPIIPGQDELAILSGSLNHLVQTLNTQQKDLATANQQLKQDIIERKRIGEKLREQASLLDIATDAILVRDLDGVIQFWNRGAEHIYGWSAQEACGENAFTLINQSTSSEIEAIIQHVLEQGEWRGELTKLTKSGQKVIIASRWTLVRDEANKPAAILTVDTDITETKQLEAQFLRAQRLESLGALASGIAHDLNNVLTPIMGAAKLLPVTLQNIDDASARLINNLDSSAKRAGDMVKQILSFARGVDGERSLVQVAHVLAELRRVICSALPKNVSIQMNASSELWLVSADATQLHQVFMNLCVNSRDAMPDGGTLTLSAENLWIDEHYARLHPNAQIGPYVMVTIADTGIGISPDVMDRIFEPFFTTKDIGKGTGLGLSTSIGIIKSHDGFIKVYSEEGRGSTFQVYLPALESTQTQEAATSQAPTGDGEMILVVDDEILIQEITKTALESYNYRVVTAKDGNEAIAQYTEYEKEIQVVLMDMMMPSIGGAKAIDELTKINPAIKIIVTSGLAIQDTPPNMQVFLPKPYSIKELLTALDTVIHAS
ncbi:MAG: ATP-binding protein [Leptolyngbyaceae cyanobacterium MO_188.B28]|nr:ATP-binding protein [Leptolyngbyaceae cyanobacterium MO_188.B28]